MATSNIIGDIQSKATENVATALPMPRVLAADIAAAAHQINISHKSGKQLGSSIIDETGAMYVALGPLATDGWVKQTTGATVTPA